MPSMKCDACGGEAVFRQEGSTEGFFCTRCNWSVVTTHFPDIDLDEKIYQVRVAGADAHVTAHVRAIASISGRNFLETRRLIENENTPLVYEGLARQVVTARDSLTTAGLQTVITPAFVY